MRRIDVVIIERLSMTFTAKGKRQTANGKNETFVVSLQLCVQ